METPQRVRGSNGGTPTLPRDHSTLLREQEAERERLRMDNFNQALRINFLEERLLRMKQGTDFASEDLESELAQLRLTLEERDHELRQRNFSMIRATEAIDMLSAQLQEAQRAAARAKEEAEREAQAQLHQHLEARGGVDAETAEKWQAELETALDREQQSYVKIQELEDELQRQEDARTAVVNQLHELQEEITRERHEMELRRQREEQTLQQLEMTNAKVMAEVEHWKMMSKQREEQVRALKVQLETTRQEKQALEVQYQVKLKRMEEQVQHQMQQLQQENDNYRTEHTRLLTNRETLHYEKERLAIENESIRQERLRLEAEIERLTKEGEQVVEDMDRLRIENMKLSSTSKEQSKAIEGLKSEREDALETILRLEVELQQQQTQESEHDATIKRLESQLRHNELEQEAQRVQKEEKWTKLQTQVERLTKERQEMVDKMEKLRLENDNLAARYEELKKGVDEFMRDRDVAVTTIDQLEGEVHQYQNVEKEHEVRVKTLERQLERAETEIRELKEQLDAANSQPSKERLLALEKYCHSMGEDNRRLRGELIEFQMDLEAMERQVDDAVRTEAASTQEQTRLLSVSQEDLKKQSIRLNQGQKPLAEGEAESTSRTAHVRKQERHLAERMDSVSSMTAEDDQQERHSHVVTDMNGLLQELEKERRQTSEIKHVAAALKRDHLSAQRELEAVKTELWSLLSNRCDGTSQSVATLAREAIAALKTEFKTKSTAMQQRWRQQATTMNSKLERLSTQLLYSQKQLEALERSSAHEKERWFIRYEELRLKKEAEKQTFEQEIRRIQTEADETVVRELQALGLDEATGDCQALRESNRLLMNEVQERRKSAKYARKQYMVAIREKKELLKAVAMYKEAIASRDKDMEKYKAAVLKYKQQLKRRVDVDEAKQTLLKQLEQTRFMILETYKRWKESPLGCEAPAFALLDECLEFRDFLKQNSSAS
ncbi:hypothetical protein PsorP6_011731 [Peronosclerospora sorghi]|uniref:Uncharacterized protein n=1 Tax=Peronosclerospora sorghi TaxID=230839 RepID=A0ACC0WK54_9STRA|nr:hypothetical protein PsorP6_011731 [Peronosclerospora sorghi]